MPGFPIYAHQSPTVLALTGLLIVVVRGWPFLFLYQAEDGIRDHCVTGVQTCALPICRKVARKVAEGNKALHQIKKTNLHKYLGTDRKSVV